MHSSIGNVSLSTSKYENKKVISKYLKNVHCVSCIFQFVIGITTYYNNTYCQFNIFLVMFYNRLLIVILNCTTTDT